jgi:indolepyruvate ferredoxin oxidoreductase
VSAESIDAAIVLNGTAQKMNKDAFLWGRRTAVDPNAVERLLAASSQAATGGVSPARSQNLDEMIAVRSTYLTGYQDAAYAERYRLLVERVRAAERSAFPGRTALAEAVARYYFKLLAIKDEYEVARLHVEQGFLDSVARQFEGDYKLVFNLAPPLLSRRDPLTGEPKKSEFGGWIVPVFRVLAKLRFLRGTTFDVFGHTQERRMERSLVTRYEATVGSVFATLEASHDAAQYDTGVALLSLPEQIRGFGHVRSKSLESVFRRERELLDVLQRRVIPLRQAA